MPGRGLLTVTCLVLIALACLSVVRKLERERRFLRKLRARGATSDATAVPLAQFTDDEIDCCRSLAAAGVVAIRNNRCLLVTSGVPVFRRKRVRLALCGGLGALVLAVLLAMVILRH